MRQCQFCYVPHYRNAAGFVTLTHVARPADLRPVGVILREAMDDLGLDGTDKGKRTLARWLHDLDGAREVEVWRRYIQRWLQMTEPGRKMRNETNARLVAQALKLRDWRILVRQSPTPEEQLEWDVLLARWKLQSLEAAQRGEPPPPRPTRQ